MLFVLFVLVHMYGNLKILASMNAFDVYAHHLRTFLEPILPYEGLLWILRVVLILALVIHVYAAYALWARAAKARGESYSVKKALEASMASKMMRWGGTALLAFIIFHLLHFTTLSVKTWDERGTPASRLIESFENPLVYAVYFVSMVALAMHVWHGAWSALQTMGWSRERSEKTLKTIAALIAAALFIGFMLPPTLIVADVINVDQAYLAIASAGAAH